MIVNNRMAAVDVAYSGDEAMAAAVVFSGWEQDKADLVYTSRVNGIAPYVPGQFYLRELPCILAVLRNISRLPSLILVDGYVWLDESLRPGLGARVYEALEQRSAVIGVAKSRFFTGRNVVEVARGRSRKPLFITSAGIDVLQAAQNVKNMHGENRIPTLLREADRLSRVIEESR